VATDVHGLYGTFHVNADGTYSYVLDNANARVNVLGKGETLTDVLGYSVADPSGATGMSTLTVTINGTQDGYSTSSTITGSGTLVGTGSADSITGSTGRDYIEGGSGDDVIHGGGSATDTAFSTLQASTFVTTADDKMVSSSSGSLRSSVASDTNKGYGDLVHGGDGNDAVIGGSGTDLLYGGAGDDYLSGGSGSDVVRGGTGADRVEGGKGSDIMMGGTGADVFAWSLGDGATSSGATSAGTNSYGIDTSVNVAGTVDYVSDFSKSDGDTLDLRDLLVGESHQGVAAGNLANYLHFEKTTDGSVTSTVVHVSTSGGFSNGTYNAAAEDQTIVLKNVNLLTDSSGTALLNDNAVIQDLLSNKRLIVD
jgi:surface adhesion protein